MANQLFKNNAGATLNGTIAIGNTTINVAAGQGARFPAPTAGDYFLLTIYEKDVGGVEFNYEVVKVTARTADSLTVVRDFEGLVVDGGGTSGGWAYPSSVGLNPSQVVYLDLRYTAYACGNTLAKDDNLASVASAATARINLGLGNVENKTFAVGTADATHAATSKTTPVDADEIPMADSAASWGLKKLTWANLKATLKSYFDSLYPLRANNLSDLANAGTARTNLGAEGSANKDASGGYAGLTLFKLNLRNAANTITSWFTTAATVARTWTMPDKDGTVAMTSDVPVGGTPALTLGTANTAGSSPNFLRRDDTILVFDATSPAAQGYGDAAAVGVATVAARRDHKHSMPASTKDTTAVTGLLKGNGTAVSAATVRTDYAEPTTALATGILKNTTTTGAHTIAAAGTDYQAPIGTISGVAKGNGANALTAAVANTDYLAPTGSDAVVTRQMTKDMGVVFLDKGNSGTTAQTLDYTAGSHQKITVTGAFTLNAVSNWPPTGNLGEILLELTNGASSAVTWPTINWVKSDGSFTTTFASNGVTLQTSGTDFVMLWTRDAGTTVYGKIMR